MTGRTPQQSPATRRPSAGSARRPGQRGAATRRGGGRALTRKQIVKLKQIARAAFEHQEAMGLIEDDARSRSARLKAWIRAEQLAAVGIESLNDCGNDHFRSIRAHFLALGGREDAAYRDHTRTGRVKDHGEKDDTHEARELVRRKISDELLAHGRRCDPQSREYQPALAATVERRGGIITAGYVHTLARAKGRGKPLAGLTRGQLWQIYYTLRNRIADREERGDRDERNKKQRGR